jgi:hypothetical protein
MYLFIYLFIVLGYETLDFLYPPSPFCFSYFSGRVSHFLPWPALNLSPPISASHVAGVTGVCHCSHLCDSFSWMGHGQIKDPHREGTVLSEDKITGSVTRKLLGSYLKQTKMSFCFVLFYKPEGGTGPVVAGGGGGGWF